MKIKTIIKDLFWGLYDDEYIMSKVKWDDVLNIQITNLKNDNARLSNDNSELRIDNKLNTATVVNILKEFELHGVGKTEVDVYCEHNYDPIKNIAYKNKKSFKGIPYSVFLNELIQPNNFEVQNFKKKVPRHSDTKIDAKRVGNKVASYLTWTSDTNLSTSGDYYVSPSETIVYKDVDCEDHAYLVSSISRTFGVGYGSVQIQNGAGPSWHAFNVFIHNGELYILDTVTDSAIIQKYSSPNCNYTIDYVITDRHTYKVEGRVNFGVIAGWD